MQLSESDDADQPLLPGGGFKFHAKNDITWWQQQQKQNDIDSMWTHLNWHIANGNQSGQCVDLIEEKK